MESLKAQLAEANANVKFKTAVMELLRETAQLRETCEKAFLPLERMNMEIDLDKVQCLTSEGVILSKGQLWGWYNQGVREQPTLLPLWVLKRGICNTHSPTIIKKGLFLLSYRIHLLLL